MANIIRICCALLFIDVWLTEAYSRKRRESEYESHDDKNENLLVENLDSIDKKHIINDDMNVNLVNTEKHPTKNNSWVDLAISFSRLARPYVPNDLYNLNLDWTQVVVALKSFEKFTTSDEKAERSSTGSSPIEKSIRAAAAATAPMLMDVVRMALGMLLSLIGNEEYWSSGHTITRRAATEDVLDDVMAALTAIMDHLIDSGRGKQYHEIEDL